MFQEGKGNWNDQLHQLYTTSICLQIPTTAPKNWCEKNWVTLSQSACICNSLNTPPNTTGMTYHKQQQKVRSKTGKTRSHTRAPTILLPQVMTTLTSCTNSWEIFCIFEGMTIMSS